MKRQSISATVSKLNPKWVKHTCQEFREFLKRTNFPDPVRNGTRGSQFEYPEWLIMFIAVLSVKAKVKSYLGIHRLAVAYWSLIAPDPNLKPISESQLRERLKKSGIRLENLQDSFLSSFLQQTWHRDDLAQVGVVSADKMMVKARGPVWHKKQKQQGIVPADLHGLDLEATWCFSKADGWVYGHGTFCLTLHEPQVLGAFKWMPNSAHEAKRLQAELPKFERQIKMACMDSKADDYPLYRELKDQYDIQLLTTMRRGKDKTPERQQMRKDLSRERHRRLYAQRSQTVEPMQSLVKNIFDLDQC